MMGLKIYPRIQAAPTSLAYFSIQLLTLLMLETMAHMLCERYHISPLYLKSAGLVNSTESLEEILTLAFE